MNPFSNLILQLKFEKIKVKDWLKIVWLILNNQSSLFIRTVELKKLFFSFSKRNHEIKSQSGRRKERGRVLREEGGDVSGCARQGNVIFFLLSFPLESVYTLRAIRAMLMLVYFGSPDQSDVNRARTVMRTSRTTTSLPRIIYLSFALRFASR